MPFLLLLEVTALGAPPEGESGRDTDSHRSKAGQRAECLMLGVKRESPRAGTYRDGAPSSAWVP